MPQAELKEQPVAWQPDEETRKRARLTEFLNQIKVNDFESGYKKSIEDPEWFTEQVIKFLDIRFDPKPERTLDTSEGPEFAKWLIGAGLNISTACLDRWIEKGFGKNTAILWEGEEGDVFSLSYENLLGEAVRLAGILRNSEVKKGDAVGIFMPMVPETVIALMAIARIGAIAVPVFSGYGAEAITARMQAVKAKALIIADGTFRRGKWVDMLERAAEAVKASQSIQSVIISPRIATASDEKKLKALQSQISEFFKGYKTEIYSVLGIEIEKDKAALDEGTPLLEKTLAEDPLIILYTSGTTGRPKGIAHTHSSFPIKAAQDMAFGTDVGQGTKICWYTDIGWMMGPWLIYGALINGAVVCLFDGAPDYPELDRIWQFAARHEVEALGISPTLIRAQASVDSDGVKVKRNDLSKLRILASTGEPWNPDPWWWLFNNIGKGKIPIINYSGGTEISGGILMNNPLLPIKPCGFSAPCLGIDADILDENGKTVSEGEVGELVIKKPWIGMARGFWNEPERYLATYWSRFPKIWVHGDWALRDGD
ncbi:MAG TPA: AMP-binding protein, partial [Pyrinomonadaceae bacterium]|nr:AMP-binding protein [Pyrinomonadaceae bacterium]